MTVAVATDLSWITPRMAVGSGPGPHDARMLVEYGVTHVLDVRMAEENRELRVDHPRQRLLWHPRLDYRWNPTPDDNEPKPADWFGRSINYAFFAHAYPGSHLLVVCASGVERAPSTAYAILRAFGLPGAVCEELIHTGRPDAELTYRLDADLAVSSLGYQ